MSTKKDKNQLNNHRRESISYLDNYLQELIDSDDEDLMSKSDKLSYWLSDWTTFLKFEPQFSPLSLRRYKRGEIIKVHLGFNVGSEEGGLHYAVIIENNNPKSSPVVTIIPLTSVKKDTDIEHLNSGSVYLGNELYTTLNAKLSSKKNHIVKELETLRDLEPDVNRSQESSEILDNRINKLVNEMKLVNKIKNEISKMKTGSIALVKQITTISKIRIYDPKTDYDILSNIRLSNEKLDMIDKEIIKNFTHI